MIYIGCRIIWYGISSISIIAVNAAQIGAHGKPVVFLHPKDCNGVLVELEEAWKLVRQKISFKNVFFAIVIYDGINAYMYGSTFCNYSGLFNILTEFCLLNINYTA